MYIPPPTPPHPTPSAAVKTVIMRTKEIWDCVFGRLTCSRMGELCTYLWSNGGSYFETFPELWHVHKSIHKIMNTILKCHCYQVCVSAMYCIYGEMLEVEDGK